MKLRGKRINRVDAKDNFTKIPNKLIEAKNLKPIDFRIICYLYSTPPKWILAYTRMAKDFGCDKKTILSSWKRLLKNGIIVETPTHYQVDLSKLEFTKSESAKEELVQEIEVKTGETELEIINTDGGSNHPIKDVDVEKILHPIVGNITPVVVENFQDIGGESPSTEKDLDKDLEEYYENYITNYSLLSGDSLHFSLNIYLPQFNQLNSLGEYLISIYSDEFPKISTINELSKASFIYDSIYLFYKVNSELPTKNDVEILRKCFMNKYQSLVNDHSTENTSRDESNSFNNSHEKELELSINESIESRGHTIVQVTHPEFKPLELKDFITQIYTPQILSITFFKDYITKVSSQLFYDVQYHKIDDSIKELIFQNALLRFFNRYHSLPQVGDMFTLTAFRIEFQAEISISQSKLEHTNSDRTALVIVP